MFFGEWQGPSGKFEEAILNPAYGEQHVLDFLQPEMIVYVRQPKENTRKTTGTKWRAYMRPLSEQPIWVQEAVKGKPTPQPAAPSIASPESLRVTINDPFLAQHCREVAQQKGYVGNTAGSKAVMDVIRAAMKIEPVNQNKTSTSIQISNSLDKKYLEFLVQNAPRMREEPHFGEINTFEDAANACIKFCRANLYCLNRRQMDELKNDA